MSHYRTAEPWAAPALQSRWVVTEAPWVFVIVIGSIAFGVRDDDSLILVRVGFGLLSDLTGDLVSPHAARQALKPPRPTGPRAQAPKACSVCGEAGHYATRHNRGQP